MLSLGKSAQRLQNAFVRHVAGAKLSQDRRESIEEALLEADLGFETAQELATEIAAQGFRNPDSLEEVQTRLRELVVKKLKLCEADENTLLDKKRLLVAVLLGLNGCGKTSTAGKLAARFQAQGAKVMLVAGDTFRAAATEQLQAWAARSQSDIVTGERHSDPAALAFQALARAREQHYDLLLFDTAGRQDSDANLMQQLAKIERALAKQASIPATKGKDNSKDKNKDTDKKPHIEFWLVLDATLGQTLASQVQRFAAVVPVRRLLLTKLDSSARAGALVSLARKKEPVTVQYLASGEGLQDLAPFRAQDFATALVALC